MNNSIQKVYGKITVDSINPGLADAKGTVRHNSGQIRQVVTSIYPAARSGNSLSDGLYPDATFGTGQSYDSARVAFVKVPVGTTVAQLAEQLAKNPNARLVRLLSLFPIITDEERSAMSISGKTEQDYARKQMIIDQQSNPVQYKGHYQYGRTVLRLKGGEDEDTRETDLAELTQPVSMARQSETV